MIDSLIGGLVSFGAALLALAWLAQRQQRLERQVQEIGCTPAAPEALDGYEELVGQMVDQLKSAADIACREVGETIATLRRVQSGMASDEPQPDFCSGETVAASAPPAAPRRGLPVDRMVELAQQGLSTIDIARETGTGLSEVELALRYHRGKTQFYTARRRIEAVRRGSSKEVAVA